jgi:uncharacterized protein (DUF362 family)/ferredoxin
MAGALERLLPLTGGLGDLVRPGASVFLKPNVVAPFAQAATDLGLLAALVQSVRRCGGLPVIGESAGFEFDTAATLRVSGLERLAAELGVPLLNLDTEEHDARPAPGWGTLPIARAALQADVLINVPKLKLHNLTGVTLGAKNLMGLLPRTARRQLHVRGIERGIAALAAAVPVALTVVDASVVTPRAVFAQPRPLGLLLAGRELAAVDNAGRALLGFHAEPVDWLGEPGESVPAPLNGLRPLGGRVYAHLMRELHLVDTVFAALSGGRSLVPWANYYLAVRPALDRSVCDGCGRCADVCPMAAIDVRRKTIMAGRCMRLRCLRCLEACPRGALALRGWRKPREG